MQISFFEYLDKEKDLKVILETAIPVFHGKSPRENIPALDLFFKFPQVFYTRYHSLVKNAPHNIYAKEVLWGVNKFLDTMDALSHKVWAPYVHLHYSREEGYILDANEPISTLKIPQERYVDNIPHEVIRTLEHSKDFDSYVHLFRGPLGITRYDRDTVEKKIKEILLPQSLIRQETPPKTTPPKNSGASADGQFSLF